MFHEFANFVKGARATETRAGGRAAQRSTCFVPYCPTRYVYRKKTPGGAGTHVPVLLNPSSFVLFIVISHFSVRAHADNSAPPQTPSI